MVATSFAGYFPDEPADAAPGIPLGCPVLDCGGEAVGTVSGADADGLLVRHALLFVDRVPFAAVAGFDGEAVRLVLAKEEVRGGCPAGPRPADTTDVTEGTHMVTMSSSGGTPSIQECLIGVEFPISKADLLDRLQANGATELLLEPIRNAPATRFGGPQEVIEAVRAG